MGDAQLNFAKAVPLNNGATAPQSSQDGSAPALDFSQAQHVDANGAPSVFSQSDLDNRSWWRKALDVSPAGATPEQEKAFYLANQKKNEEFNNNAPDVPLGAAKAVPRGLIELDNSVVHGLQHLGIAKNEKDVPIPDVLQPKNGSQVAGGVIENILEFMWGEGELKAAGLGAKAMEAAKTSEKFSSMGKVAKFLEENPRLAELLGNSIRNGTVSGAQTLAHGGSAGDAAKSAALGTGVGAVLEGAGIGVRKLGSSILSGTAGNATAQAASEFGVPLSVAQKTASPIAQKVESILQKIPGSSGKFTKLATSQDAAIKQAASDIADSIATKSGASVTESGEAIQDAINDAKSTAGKSYAAAQQQISDAGAAQLPVSLKGKIATAAKNLLAGIELPEELSAGVKDVQGRQAAVDVLKNLAKDTAQDGTERSMTWETARRLKSQLFDLANSGESNIGKGAIKQMTSAIDQSMQDTLVNAGKNDLANQFQKASNNYRAISDAMDTSIVKRLSNTDPIDVGKFLVSNVSPNAVQTLKQVAPSQMPQIQRGIWEEIFNRALSNPDGVVAGKVLQREFQKLGTETAKAVFSPEQLDSIQKLVSLTGKIGLGGAKNSIGNVAALSAGGGAAGAELANPKLVKGLLIHTPSVGSILVTSRMLANLMTKPNGPELIANAFTKTGGAVRSTALKAIVNSLAIQHAQDQDAGSK